MKLSSVKTIIALQQELHLDDSTLESLLDLPQGKLETLSMSVDNHLSSRVLIALYRFKTLIKADLETLLSVSDSPFIRGHISLKVFSNQEDYLASREYQWFNLPHFCLYHALLAQLEILLRGFHVIGRTGYLDLIFDDYRTNFSTTYPSKMRYLRERAFLTIDEAAILMATEAETVKAWEDGAQPFPFAEIYYQEYLDSAFPDSKMPQPNNKEIYSYKALKNHIRRLIDTSKDYYGTHSQT